MTPRSAPSIRHPPGKSKPFSCALPLFATFFAFLADYACILKKNALNSPRTLPPSAAQRPLGRCQSGRMSTIGNRVYVKSVPRVRIPPCPLRVTKAPRNKPRGASVIKGFGLRGLAKPCILSVHAFGTQKREPRYTKPPPSTMAGAGEGVWVSVSEDAVAGRAVEGAFSFSVGKVTYFFLYPGWVSVYNKASGL